MFFLDKDMPGSLPTLFAMTNVLLGIIGFLTAVYFIKNNNEWLIPFCWIFSYGCMFGILTFGYDRFLYAGTFREWHMDVEYSLFDFFQSNVRFFLLLKYFRLY